MTSKSSAVEAPKPDKDSKSWFPVRALLVVLITYFGAQYVSAIVLVVFGLISGRTLDGVIDWLGDSSIAQFANSLLFYGLMVYVVYLVLKRSGGHLRDIGLVRPKFRDIGIALLGIVPYVAGYLVLLGLATEIFPGINVNQEQQLGFDRTQQGIGLLFTFFSLVILPPLVEEIVMRGYLFTSFIKRYRFVISALVTSVVFAAPHLQLGSDAPPLWSAAVDTFVLSLVLCYMRYKSGSLWPGIILHALKNGVAFFSIFVFQVT